MITHFHCDASLLFVCTLFTFYNFNTSDIVEYVTSTINNFPYVYTHKFEYTSSMNAFLATSLYILGIYAVLKIDFAEGHSHKSLHALADLSFGYIASISTSKLVVNLYMVYLLVTVFTNSITHSYGPFYMTTALNYIYKVTLLLELLMTTGNIYNVSNMWMITYSNITIRLIMYFVTPYISFSTNETKAKVSLVYDPLCSIFSTYLGFYITMIFVVSPPYLLFILSIVSILHLVYPPEFSRPNGSIKQTVHESTSISKVYDNIFIVVFSIYAIICWRFSGLSEFLRYLFDNLKQFPNHFNPNYDFITTPMHPYIAQVTYCVTVYFLVKTYYVEKNVVKRAHKKYKAHEVSTCIKLHGIGSSIELSLGTLAIMYPNQTWLAYICAFIALLNNIPTGFVLTPGVYGVKHITVPGFAVFGIIRIMECTRVFCVHPRNYANAWILLQVGTVVRLLGYFVLPFSSINGSRGDLFTEQLNYCTNILLSGYICASFVYHPAWLVVSVIVYAFYQYLHPHTVSANMRPVLTNA